MNSCEVNKFKMNHNEVNFEEGNLEKKREIAGWEGPVCLVEGAYRYTNYISWIRLFINMQADGKDGCRVNDFSGGATGSCQNFEVRREMGQWMRYEIDMAWTPKGEPVLRLRGYSSWDLVYNCISDGTPIDEKIQNIDDLAEYLERCFP